MSSLSEEGGCYSWSPIFESAYDSAASRWLAFGAINRLTLGEMNSLWRGRLSGARTFYLGSIASRQSLWPDWLDELFAPRILRFCRECIRFGYHSIFHQVQTIKECPWHAEKLTDACLRCGCPQAVWVDRYHPRARCIRCRSEPYPELSSKLERSSGFLADESKAFRRQAIALSRLREVSVRMMLPTVEYLRISKKPSVSEVIEALALTHRLPENSVRAMIPRCRPVVDAVVEPLVRGSKDSCADGPRSVWRRIQKLTALGGCLPAAVRSLDERPYSLEAGAHIQLLMQPVGDGVNAVTGIPCSDAYWTLVLRALASDWDFGRMGLSFFVQISLCHRLLIRYREREPEWLIIRAIRP